jgi:predicted nucleic acid-binding protein
MTYLDTSALVKRFVAETGSPVVHALVIRHGPVATAKIAYAEVHAGLARKRREGHLSERQYVSTCRLFETDWRAYVRVDLHDEVLVLARDLLRRHPLKGFDAIHLASALSLSTALSEEITFAAADTRLLDAARAERLRALNVERATPP